MIHLLEHMGFSWVWDIITLLKSCSGWMNANHCFRKELTIFDNRKVCTFLGKFFPTWYFRSFLMGCYVNDILRPPFWHLTLIFRVPFGKTKASPLPVEIAFLKTLAAKTCLLCTFSLWGLISLPATCHYGSNIMTLTDLFPCSLATPSVEAGLCFVCCPPVYRLRAMHRADVSCFLVKA